MSLAQTLRNIAVDIGTIVGHANPRKDDPVIAAAIEIAKGTIAKLKQAAPEVPGGDVVTDEDVDAHFQVGIDAADNWARELAADLEKRTGAGGSGGSGGAGGGLGGDGGGSGDGGGDVLPTGTSGGDAAAT